MRLDEVRSLRRDARAVWREMSLVAERWSAGVPPAQMHALVEIAGCGPIRPSELAQRVGTDPATIARSLRALSDRGWVESAEDPEDGRQRRVALTAAGRAIVDELDRTADAWVAEALAALDAGERAAVTAGLRACARALEGARRRGEYEIRPIRTADDPQVAAIIRQVMPEFGADGPGFAIHDPEVGEMSAAYAGGRARYLVIVHRGRVVGGGGFAPLVGGDADVCELRKMYFLPETRGLGLGVQLLRRLLAEAAEAGFVGCYLETLGAMGAAIRLYEGSGFHPLEGPMGATGHHGCNRFYFRPL